MHNLKTSSGKSIELVSVDIETTGLNPFVHDIIEVAVLDMNDILLVHRRILPLNPEKADPRALQVNGFNEETWKASANLCDIATAMKEVAAAVEGKMIVGSNPQFDCEFLKYHCHFLGVAWKPYYKSMDITALSLVKTKVLNSLKDAAVAEGINVSHQSLHTADADARTARAAFLLLATDLGIF